MSDIPDNVNTANRSWAFLQNAEGYVALYLNSNAGLVPILFFGSPETFLVFVHDAVVAGQSFTSKSLRDAIDIVKKAGTEWRRPPEAGHQARLLEWNTPT